MNAIELAKQRIEDAEKKLAPQIMQVEQHKAKKALLNKLIDTAAQIGRAKEDKEAYVTAIETGSKTWRLPPGTMRQSELAVALESIYFQKIEQVSRELDAQ